MPLFLKSRTIASTALACKCTSTVSIQTSSAWPPTLHASRRWASKSTSPNWTWRFLPMPAENVRDTADLTRQADIYRRIAQACFAHPGCTAIQTWGFADKYSWIRSRTKGTKGAALLFDCNYAPKPAYVALKEALATRKPTLARKTCHSDRSEAKGRNLVFPALHHRFPDAKPRLGSRSLQL